MNVAIVGCGISGLIAAVQLQAQHQLTLYEAAEHLGGHAHTVEVDLDGQHALFDVGFMVFNERTYPQFTRLLANLNIASLPTSMSFSVCEPATGLEYNGHSLNTLFAQRSNLLRPSFYRLLAEIVRFNRAGRELNCSVEPELTVDHFLRRGGYSRQFARHYLLPLGAAIWSCAPEEFGQFPLGFLLEFFRNHGLLDLVGRPVWRVVRGGSRAYVEAVASRLRAEIKLRTPVTRARRFADRVQLVAGNAPVRDFDHVVFACHSDQALKILGADATPAGSRTARCLSVPTKRSRAAHRHFPLAAQPPRTWASWNFRVGRDEAQAPLVTYNLSHLQQVAAPRTVCLTLNDQGQVGPQHVLRRFEFQHPVFTVAGHARPGMENCCA